MNKFKIGDRVVVVDAQSVYDNYSNGDVGTVNGFDSNPSVAGFVRRDYDGLEMNVYWTEVIHLKSVKKSPMPEKETEMTVEQIREEIFRMDSRIEEAKRDIENAETERNSFVEKLREKGFELSGKMQVTDGGYNVCTVDNVKEGDILILTEESWNNDIPSGSQVRVIKNDFSDIPLKIKTLDGLYEDWTKIDTVKFK